MLTIGSLFSGIGMFELGLELAGLGPVLWQVEKEPFRRAVLAHHWPEARRFDDVQTVTCADLAPVDLICGGFPCQDISSAGSREGLSGERSGLWREFARLVGDIRPAWVAIENVSSNARAWVDPVVSELASLGYESLPIPITASACGAFHERARVFVVAHIAENGEQARLLDTTEQALNGTEKRSSGSHGTSANANENGKPSGSQHAEVAFPPEPFADSDGGPVRLDEQRLDEQRLATQRLRVRVEGDTLARFPSWAGGAFAEPSLVRVVHGRAGKLDGCRVAKAKAREANVGLRREALGDSIVPQCAEVVGWVIRELAGLTEAA